MVYRNLIENRKPYDVHKENNEIYVAELAYHSILTKYPESFHEQDLDDLLQECYIATFERWENFESQGHNVATRASIVERLVYKRFLKYIKESEKVHDAEETYAATHTNCYDGLENACYICATHDLDKALSMIPVRCKGVLVMRYFDGMTLKRAGREMNVTQERARQLEAKGLRLLRHPRISRTLSLRDYIL